MRGEISKRSVDGLAPGHRDLFLWDTDLAGFGLKVTPEGRKVYVVQYRMGGRGSPTRRLTLGKHGVLTPDEARRLAKKALAQVTTSIDPAAQKAHDKVNTVEALVKAFVKSRRDKSRRSADEVEGLLKRITAAWSQRPVSAIDRGDIVRLLDDILATGARTAANRALAHLKTMFTWAENRGLIKESPCKGIEKPSAENSRERSLTDDELIEVWLAADQLGFPFGRAVQLLILTGQRREEVGQMGWSELALDRNLWTLPGSRTKNGQPHDIHLSTMAADIIKSLPRFVGEDGPAELVFTTTGKTPISGWGKAKIKLDEKILAARMKTAEETGEDVAKVAPMPAWTINDLRRTFSTGLNDLRVLPHVADRILNHVAKKKGGVMAVYNRAAYATERKLAMTLWSEHIERLLAGKPDNVLTMKRN